MQITACFTANGLILAEVDGVSIGYVPDDMENRDRQLIAEWEAAGNVIAPYVAPEQQISDPRLTEAEAMALLAAVKTALGPERLEELLAADEPVSLPSA